MKLRVNRGVRRGDTGNRDELMLEREIGSEVIGRGSLARRRNIRRASEQSEDQQPPHPLSIT